jgi:hypothetical protein
MKPLALKVFGLACLVSAVAGAARAVDLQTLVDRSPFSPPGQGNDASSATEAPPTLEFRGMVTDADGTAYSIYDTSTNKGRWVRADDANSPVQVKSFDPVNNTLEVEQNGRPLKLALKRATIQAGQPVAAAIPNAPTPAGGNPAAPGAVRRPDSAADARRLEAVAAEVRRRRALRNAANNRQGQPPANVAPAPAAPSNP